MSGLKKPLKIAILAMGGQGGGVLANWLIEAAERAGYLAQSTAVPGVAQRTGATVYYLEMAPRHESAGEPPILALMPVPGHVDVLIAGELVEAGRAVLRGLITPARTVAIVSTHRDYAIDEKTAPGDGRVDAERVTAVVAASARQFVGFDMATLAEETGSVISSVLLGAIAGSGALPVGGEVYREVIRGMGVAVAANLAGFEAGHRAATRQSTREVEIGTGNRPSDGRVPAAAGRAKRQPGVVERAAPDQIVSGPQIFEPNSQSPASDSRSSPSPSPLGTPHQRRVGVSSTGWSVPGSQSARLNRGVLPKDIQSLLDRLREQFPEETWEMLEVALRRLIDYQDPRYAADFLDRMRPIRQLDTKHRGYRLTRATARYLALGMTFEDVIRVADLKTRSQRFAQIREEARAEDDQVVTVEEYLHPRVEEVCDVLPARVGAWCLNTAAVNKSIGWFCRKGRRIQTTGLTGFLFLYLMARLRRFRRGTLRYKQENTALRDWLTLILRIAPEDYDLAVEVAECRRLVKGYGETHAKGLAHFDRLIAEAKKRSGTPDAAEVIKRQRERTLSAPET